MISGLKISSLRLLKRWQHTISPSLSRMLLIVALTGCFLLAHGQQNRVFTGRIIDKQSKGPIVGANIYLKKDMSIGSVSDFNGYFAINIIPGTYQFLVSFT
ncbi:MAG: carboxypeptidase-like regulatory domain-containing protein, partial [Bacteroidales bacterium]